MPASHAPAPCSPSTVSRCSQRNMPAVGADHSARPDRCCGSLEGGVQKAGSVDATAFCKVRLQHTGGSRGSHGKDQRGPAAAPPLQHMAGCTQQSQPYTAQALTRSAAATMHAARCAYSRWMVRRCASSPSSPQARSISAVTTWLREQGPTVWDCRGRGRGGGWPIVGWPGCWPA